MQISRWIFIWTWSLCHITCNLFTVYAYSTFKFHTIWIIYSFLKQKKTVHIYFWHRWWDIISAKFSWEEKSSYIFMFTFFYIFSWFSLTFNFFIPLCVFVIIWWEHEHYSIWIVPSFESQSSSSCEIRKKGLDGWNVHLQEKWSHECLHEVILLNGRKGRNS